MALLPGLPVEALPRLQQASGAAVVPVEISLNQPVQPAITQTLEQITQGLQDTQLSWQEHYQLPDLSDAHALVDEYCMAWAAGFPAPTLVNVGDKISRESLIARLGLPEQLHRYADYFLHMWQQDDFVEAIESVEAVESAESGAPVEPAFRFVKPIDDVRDPDEIKRELNKITHLFDGPLRLMRHTIDSFPTVLNNEIQPIEVLDPDGANQMIQEIYTGSVQQVEDELIMSLFEALFQNILKVSSIRILEVGGGYGMAMRRIMPMMAHLKVQFWFPMGQHLYYRRQTIRTGTRLRQHDLWPVRHCQACEKPRLTRRVLRPHLRLQRGACHQKYWSGDG